MSFSRRIKNGLFQNFENLQNSKKISSSQISKFFSYFNNYEKPNFK